MAIVGGGIAAALIGAGIGHADDNHNHSGGESDGAGPFKARCTKPWGIPHPPVPR